MIITTETFTLATLLLWAIVRVQTHHYEFVKTCCEIPLIPNSSVIGRLRQSLMTAAVSFELLEALPKERT